MSEMLERIARAICQANQMDPDAKSHIDGNEWHWEDYVKDAKAAIRALREPTDAMLEAGGSEPYLASAEAGAVLFAEIRNVIAPENIWNAMLDAVIDDD